MLRIANRISLRPRTPVSGNLLTCRRYKVDVKLPQSADVVIIGGGSAGCHILYHLSKRGVKAVLLERAKVTSGTTWHTSGLIWQLRPNDVEVELLASSRRTIMGLEAETGLDPGWIQNGGIFLAHSEVRMNEYKRLASLGSAYGIESHILTPPETKKYFPLLNENAFTGALYAPGDGVIDPAMLCAALTKAGTSNGGRVIENCPVTDILTDECPLVGKKVAGVSTPYGVVKTNCVVNATGVWGQRLAEKFGTKLPLVPMRHAYIITESAKGVRGLPNIRDHDHSIYFRIQGDAIQMGGYEHNPILLEKVPKNFQFSLYDLDWSVFDAHVKGAVDICPVFGNLGIKTTVCGPESFTPDHKPLMGPDPNAHGLFHHCGFNSAGMMLGGGCAEQTALWIIQGRPERHMFNYNLCRFSPKQTNNSKWVLERSHESYAKNYSTVFPNDQPLASRNLQTDPLHQELIEQGAIMDEKQGWERPSYFISGVKAQIPPYDWYGAYGYKKNENSEYLQAMQGDLDFGFSKHHDLIGKEALACRNNVVVFDMSYFNKMYLEGPEADQAANWLFTAKTNRQVGKISYTCMLNSHGGVEGDVTVHKISSGSGQIHDPKIAGTGYYIVSGGASAYYCFTNADAELKAKGFKAALKDVTSEMGIISIQGRKSRDILQTIVDIDLSDKSLPPYSATLANILTNGGSLKRSVRVMRVSFVGELGYELHIPNANCVDVYKALMEAGKADDIRNAGYRALYSLSSEKGYHLWGFDIRSDDTPVEANLTHTCRKEGEYNGKKVVDSQLRLGTNKKLVYLTLKEQVPVWGLESVYRNGELVGHLRRGDYAYSLNRPVGQAFLIRKDGKLIDDDFIKSGNYKVNVMGKLYDAECFVSSPFDPESKRILGIY